MERRGFFFEKDYKKDIYDIKKQVGYLSENNPLYPEMYVKEYFRYVSGLYRLKDPPIDRLMKQTGLLEYRRKKYKHYLKVINKELD